MTGLSPVIPPIGLALSGGGSRAIAFHLGCLRALDKVGLLDHVVMISAVSGGSVIAALYCSHEGDFDTFEAEIRRNLSRGFFRPAIRVALTTLEGVKAGVNFIALVLDRATAAVVKFVLRFVPWRSSGSGGWPYQSLVRRQVSRTTILRRAFNEVFGGKSLGELRGDRPRLFIIACELRAKAAFYYTSTMLHCWRYGSSASSELPIAHAVAASAAYPLALPALDETITFQRNGHSSEHRVTLTDGGVYDNLGLAPFWPGRDSEKSIIGPAIERLVICKAGYGLSIGEPAAMVLSRMKAVFESVFARAENAGIARVFDRSTKGFSFIMPYLGQDDAKLLHAPPYLIRRADAEHYPTNFASMSEVWIDRLSGRGEQLTLALLRQHWPDLIL